MSSTHETEVVRGIRSDYKYGFSNPDDAKDYFFKSGRGISHEVLVLAKAAVHVEEEDALLLELGLELVVDDLRLVLRAHTGEVLLLRLGDAELVPGVENLGRQVLP